MSNKFYITTAIAYTSRKPHIGNSYDIVLADMSVISKGVLHQCVSIGTSTLGEFLIGLGQVDTVALNPGRNPSEVLSVSLAIGEIDLIIKVLGLGIELR